MHLTLTLPRAFLSTVMLAGTAAAVAADLPRPPLPPLPPLPPIVAPGLPGRVDVSRLPLPQVVVQSPTIIIRPPPLPTPPGVVVATPSPAPAPPPRTAPPPRQQPVYMWVPPGHRKHWAKHCHRYQACGVPVLFVRDDWYDKHVHKGAKHRDDDDDKPGRGPGRGHDKGGEAGGHGKGHGKG